MPEKLAGQFDLILSTVAVDLDWQPYFDALAPKGNFHTVGAVMKPFQAGAFSLIQGDRAVTGSSTGSPGQIRSLLKLASRTEIAPKVEFFPMSKTNDALDHMRTGKASYRVVLKADF